MEGAAERDAMKSLKDIARGLLHSSLRRVGLDVRRVQTVGNDPFADMRRFLGGAPGVSKPVIFDVGANTGQSVRRFKETFPESVVHTFEPSPKTFAALTANVGGLPGVKPWNLGVGAAEGELSLNENTNADMSSFLAQGKDCWGNITARTTVPVVTLDGFARKEGIDAIDVLKCDTQGFEMQVFEGARGLFAARKIGLVYCEVTFSEMYEGAATMDEVFRFMRENGLVLVSYYERFYQNDLIGWTDMLFVSRERAGMGKL
jgi:FkbM family methyltransferase